MTFSSTPLFLVWPNVASFVQDNITKPPLLTTGEISLEVLAMWEDGALGYFTHKEIKATDQSALHPLDSKIHGYNSDFALTLLC